MCQGNNKNCWCCENCTHHYWELQFVCNKQNNKPLYSENVNEEVSVQVARSELLGIGHDCEMFSRREVRLF